MVTGLDLVELQLRVAAGEELPIRQEDVTFSGHAIEFRINAEDPWDGFKPSSGRIERMDPRTTDRIDLGFSVGDTIPTNYDSLLGKLIKWGSTREDAISRLEGGALKFELRGPATNFELLRRVVMHPEFSSGDAGVNWLAIHLPELLAGQPPPEHWAAVAASLALLSNSPWTYDFRPWQGASWIGSGTGTVWLSDGQTRRSAEVAKQQQRFFVSLGDERVQLELADGTGKGYSAETVWKTNRVERPFVTVVKGDIEESDPFRTRDDYEASNYETWQIAIVPPPSLPRRAAAVAAGATAIVAPLSGTIAAVRIAERDAVETGQVLLLLEAMKMEHRIVAPGAGVVKAVLVKDGDVVREGDVLVELAAE
jgi:acetyl/propionyl-CoA carboxylase alpha subunit